MSNFVIIGRFCIKILPHFVDFNDLYEAYHSLENGTVEGILVELFTVIEFIQGKADSRRTVAQVLEEKHGYVVAIKIEGFNSHVRECLPRLTEFVS